MKEQSQDRSAVIKIGAVVLCVAAIMIFSIKKSFYSDSDSDSSAMFLIGYLMVLIISLVIYVFLARWTFKVNEIVSNQEKTNQLLESINKALLKSENNLPDGDVNNPENLKNFINKLK